MYVFSFEFWLAMAALAMAHAFVGPRAQRWLLLTAGLVVYGSLDPTLLVALAGVIGATWIGIRAAHYTDDRAMLRFVRVVSSVLAFVPLAVLRLSDDVVELVGRAASTISLTSEPWSIGSVLPIGVAFYTLQAIDAVHSTRDHRQKPTFTQHALFVSFFPTMVIGPVQRYQDLAPQLVRRRTVSGADVDAAARFIVFGLFWKLAVADNLLPIADAAFSRPGIATGSEVVLGTLAFTMGVTADLAGYSAMVLGLARLFGVKLASLNVHKPYAARSPIDFWSRWLTSVSDWMYRRVFLALGGRNRGPLRFALALTATFAVGTFWYGERLNIVLWGALHLAAVLIQVAFGRRPGGSSSKAATAVATAATFGFVAYAWLWFRAPSVAEAVRLHQRLASPGFSSVTIATAFAVTLFSAALVASDYLFDRMGVSHSGQSVDEHDRLTAPAVRGAVFAMLIVGVLLLSTDDLHRSVVGLL